MPNVFSPGALLARARRAWRRREPRGVVLVYHRVARTASDPFGQAVDPATFERQLRLLPRFGTIVPATELVARVRRGAPVDRAIVVTFDDGYVDNLTTAAPIAGRLGVPITVFVTVQPIRDGTPFWWDQLGLAMLGPERPAAAGDVVVGGISFSLRSGPERMEAVRRIHEMMRRESADRRAALLREVVARLPDIGAADAGWPMTAAELRELSALPGVTIGAHTMTHPSLAALAEAEQRREMSASRAELERLLGAPPELMAYPFGKPGDISAQTQGLARAAGFAAAFTTVPHPVNARSDPFAIPRLTVHEWPDDTFTAKLEELLGPPETTPA